MGFGVVGGWIYGLGALWGLDSLGSLGFELFLWGLGSLGLQVTEVFGVIGVLLPTWCHRCFGLLGV